MTLSVIFIIILNFAVDDAPNEANVDDEIWRFARPNDDVCCGHVVQKQVLLILGEDSRVNERKVLG